MSNTALYVPSDAAKLANMSDADLRMTVELRRRMMDRAAAAYNGAKFSYDVAADELRHRSRSRAAS